jgi:hypothetical protein
MTLEPGLAAAFRYTVTEADTAAVLGSGRCRCWAPHGSSLWPSGPRWPHPETGELAWPGSSRQRTAAAAAVGLIWANMLRPFQLGKARTSHEGPWSWIRESRVASSQDIWPACHFTNASASAVM